MLPGVDVLAPISWSGLTATRPCSWAATKRAAAGALGLAADIYTKYRVDLKYTGYFGNYSTNPATGAATAFNGVFSSLSDRGWWSLTFKTTF